jgi:protein-S-isoprenylcysteine O-methyltransferase Ste14
MRYDEDMNLLDRVIIGSWIIFWLYWIISAVGAKKNASANIRRIIGIRLAILVFAVVLVEAMTLAGYNPVLAGLGFVIFLSGLTLAVWARRHLGKNWGMPMTLKQDPELVTNGPYRFIRHPIYSGILLALLGCILEGGIYWFVIVVIFGVYFIYCAYVEEKIMLKQFPKAYPKYKNSSKMLVPFIF